MRVIGYFGSAESPSVHTYSSELRFFSNTIPTDRLSVVFIVQYDFLNHSGEMNQVLKSGKTVL